MAQPKVNSSQIDVGVQTDDIVKVDGLPGTGSPLAPGLPIIDGSQVTNVDAITLNGDIAGTNTGNLVKLVTVDGSPLTVGLPAVDGTQLTAIDIVSDTSPQLGGSLDVNGQTITSGLNSGDIAVTAANGTSAEGGQITLTGGDGNGFGNFGGNITITAGDSLSAAGGGGNVTINAGIAQYAGYYGGNVTIRGAQPLALYNSHGGDANVYGGGASVAGYNAGDVNVYAGGGAAAGIPGEVTIKGGVVTGANTNGGGKVSIQGAAGANTTNGGNVEITAGAGGSTSGDGGNIVLTPGTVTSGTEGRTQVTRLLAPVPINTQAGTSYTLVLDDAGKYVRMTNAAANTVTIPSNADVAFEIGTEIIIRQAGAGATTLASPGSPAVTLNTPGSGSPASLTIGAQHNSVSIIKVAADEWDLVGAFS